MHPFFGPERYPWHRPDAVELHRALCKAVNIPSRIDLLYRRCGADLPSLNIYLRLRR